MSGEPVILRDQPVLHRGAAHAYLTGRTADRQLAADLLQEVFLRVWRHLDAVTGLSEEGQRRWIFTVARNVSIDSRRHTLTVAGTERVLASQPFSSASSALSASSAPSASDAVIQAERSAIVAAAMRQLPEPQRVVLAMSAGSGLTSKEIGLSLGIPAGTVRYRLALARQALAKALGDYDDPREER